jgi:hypothetical protein
MTVRESDKNFLIAFYLCLFTRVLSQREFPGSDGRRLRVDCEVDILRSLSSAGE